VAVWAVAVVGGGLLTLWLRDSAEPPPPAGWVESSPSPSLPEGWETRCPRPTADTDDGPVTTLCVISTAR
jgi:hypothetical protein